MSCIFCTSPSQDFVHPGYTPFPGLPPLLRQKPFSSPGRSRAELLHAAGRTFPQHKNSGAHPGLPLSAASIFFLLTGPIQAPGPGILQAQSPLALDHDTDDLFIGLFHSVLGETAHVLDGVLHTLLYDAVAAIELLAFDVHIIA